MSSTPTVECRTPPRPPVSRVPPTTAAVMEEKVEEEVLEQGTVVVETAEMEEMVLQEVVEERGALSQLAEKIYQS